MINSLRSILQNPSFIKEMEEMSISLANMKQEQAIMNLIAKYLNASNIHPLCQRESKYNNNNMKYIDFFLNNYQCNNKNKPVLARDLVIPNVAEIEAKFNYYFESDRCKKEIQTPCPSAFIKKTDTDIRSGNYVKNNWAIAEPVIKDVFHLPGVSTKWTSGSYLKSEPDIFIWIISNRIVKQNGIFNFANFAYADNHNKFIISVNSSNSPYYGFLKPFDDLILAVQQFYKYDLYGKVVTTNHHYLKSEYFFYILYKQSMHKFNQHKESLTPDEFIRTQEQSNSSGLDFSAMFSKTENPKNVII